MFLTLKLVLNTWKDKIPAAIKNGDSNFQKLGLSETDEEFVDSNS